MLGNPRRRKILPRVAIQAMATHQKPARPCPYKFLMPTQFACEATPRVLLVEQPRLNRCSGPRRSWAEIAQAKAVDLEAQLRFWASRPALRWQNWASEPWLVMAAFLTPPRPSCLSRACS
jgi:hypothetical protein